MVSLRAQAMAAECDRIVGCIHAIEILVNTLRTANAKLDAMWCDACEGTGRIEVAGSGTAVREVCDCGQCNGTGLDPRKTP